MKTIIITPEIIDYIEEHPELYNHHPNNNEEWEVVKEYDYPLAGYGESIVEVKNEEEQTMKIPMSIVNILGDDSEKYVHDRNQLKVGDIAWLTYREGFGKTGGIVRKATIKSITDKEIVAKVGSTTFNFINDDKLSYRGTAQSSTQHCHLFLGSKKEAQEFVDEAGEKEDLYIKAYEYLNDNWMHLSKETLKQIIKLMKV